MTESVDNRPSILLVSFWYPPETGAASTRLEALTTRWVDRGHDVTVLTTTPDSPNGEIHEGYNNEWIHREVHDGVEVITTKSLPSSSSDHLFRRALKYLWFTVFATLVGVLWLDRREVVLSSSPQPFAGLTGLAIARLQCVPFVFEVRDLWPESLVAMGEVNNPIVIKTLDVMTEFLYTRADRVSVVAPGMEHVVVEGGADSDDVWLHSNGIDHEFFNTESTSLVDEADFFENHFVLSYVGTIGKAQGLEVVLDVAKKLQNLEGYEDVRFVFIGFGSQYDDLAASAEERGLDNLVFLGRRPMAEVPAYLAASDAAFVHTAGRSAFETMIPMKFYEALGAGLPVVLGAQGDAVQILECADAGIAVEPGDADAIIQAVRALYDDSDRRRELAENGRQYVVDNHSWDAIAESYGAALEELEKSCK